MYARNLPEFTCFCIKIMLELYSIRTMTYNKWTEVIFYHSLEQTSMHKRKRGKNDQKIIHKKSANIFATTVNESNESQQIMSIHFQMKNKIDKIDTRECEKILLEVDQLLLSQPYEMKNTFK